MDDLAIQIAQKVVEDTKYFTTIAGLVGIIVGSVLTIIGNIVLHYLKQRAGSGKYVPRKKLLKEMLEDIRFSDKWRKLDTLMHVIGADEETTKRLLLEIDARASEDGHALWGLKKYHTFKGKKHLANSFNGQFKATLVLLFSKTPHFKLPLSKAL